MSEEPKPERPPPRVFLFIAAVCAIAIACGLWVESLPSGSTQIALVPLTAAVVVAELLLTRVRFRGETHESTLTALPLVLGLFLSSPTELLIAMIGGLVIARGIVRRQPFLKFVFNVANLTIDVTIAIALLDFLGRNDHFGPREWLTVHLALAVSSAASSALVIAAIAVSTGSVVFPLRTLLSGLVVEAGTVSVALAATAVYRDDPLGLGLFMVPVGLLYASMLAFERQRGDKERVEFLFECTRMFANAKSIDLQVEAFLAHCVEGLRTASVELCVYSVEGHDFRFQAVATENDFSIIGSVPDSRVGDLLVDAMDFANESKIVRANRNGSPVERLLGERAVDEGIVAPLIGGDGSRFGLFIVGDLLGRDAQYDDDDVQLARALAELVGPVVASDQQSSTISELRTARDELEFRATHDELTGLANRDLFLSRLSEISTQATHQQYGVLYMDLDGFKQVNDTFGHGVGDELLRAVADRLAAEVRSGDLAVRLGGDEFAVLVSNAPSAAGVGLLGQRIVDAVSEPFSVSCGEVSVGASIGIARGSRGGEPASTVAEADAAMYKAKRNGRGRVVLA